MNKIIDWKKEERYAKSLTDDELQFAINDAIAARNASKGWNPNGEGFYQDQASVYSQELIKRQKKAAAKKGVK